MIINGINVIIQRKDIKNMYLRVIPPEGDVKISAPLFVSDDKIIEFVENKIEWILTKKSQIAKMEYFCGYIHRIDHLRSQSGICAPVMEKST